MIMLKTELEQFYFNEVLEGNYLAREILRWDAISTVELFRKLAFLKKKLFNDFIGSFYTYF